MNKIRQRLYVILEKEPKREDKVSRFINIFLVCLICLNLSAIVVSLIFDLPDVVLKIFDYIEIVSVVIFSAEYLLRIWVDPYKPPSLASKKRVDEKISPLFAADFLADGIN